MNHLLDLAGSFAIGGLVLIAIVVLMLNFNGKNQENTLSRMSSLSLSTVGDVMEDDLNKLGYGVESGDKIVSLAANSITFLSDINSDGTVDTVRHFSYTDNGKKYLKRKVGAPLNHEWYIEIDSLKITAYDNLKNIVVNPAQVVSVSIEIFLPYQKKEMVYVSNDYAAGLYLKKHIYPKNL